MASKRFEVDMGLNASDVAKGAKDAERALGDLEEAVGDVGRDGARDVDKLEESLRDVQRQSERTERSLDDVGGKGFGRASDAGKEFKDETLANISEVASSFDGSMESIGDVVQGTLGGVVANLGPAIGGAAAVAAAGVGVITDAFTKAGEAADAARESAYQFAYDVQGALDQAGYTQRVAEWTGDTEKLKQAQDIAKVAGQDVASVIDALASGGDKLDNLWEAFETGAASTDVAMGRALELESALKATREGYLNGGDAAKLAAKLNYEYARSVGEATGEVDDLGNRIYELPDGVKLVVDAETKTAYEDLDAVERRTEEVARTPVNIPVKVDDSAVRNWRPPLIRIPTQLAAPNGLRAFLD